ncbi:MAG: YidC/Oxa1 family membrane protein insertase [Clostridiales bacterium]|nr:YidC/Oxa1 family membrane protein insertase [Clostridiales bacterium]
MTFLACTTVGEWPIIKQIAFLLGYVMRGIFSVLDMVNIHSIALCIILFTVITRMIMYPLTLKQQKFSKLNAVMAPELQALQKKYANKKDSQSMQKMQIEQQMIYEKYGVSMTSGCVTSLIQIPLLFALYPVIYDLEKYIPQLANFSAAEVEQMYTFFGISLKATPHLGLNPTILIPILAGAFQFISTKLMMVNQPNMDDNPMGSSMKTMNMMMPLMSVVFCFTFPCFIGIYWIAMSVVLIIQQLIINQHMKKVNVEDLIKENIEKQNKKRAKKGLPPISEKANMMTKNMARAEMNSHKAAERPSVNKEERDAKIKESTEYYQNRSAKPGSLAAKANMVNDYNEKHKK